MTSHGGKTLGVLFEGLVNQLHIEVLRAKTVEFAVSWRLGMFAFSESDGSTTILTASA